jgi:CheY-like chemotaxis protein
VVDDNDTSQRLLQSQLSAWGCRPLGAATGDEALQVLARAAAEGDPVALVLVDGAMPGTYGDGLAQAIRARASFVGVRLVLLTAGGSGGQAVPWAEAGFDANVHKPVRQSALHDCLISLLAAAPLASGEVARSRPATPTVTARPVRILLAEDNFVNQLVARLMLQRMGHTVHTAANGTEAVEACLATRFDLVLMDCQMPEMDGYEATAEIRRQEGSLRHTPIIAMTANAMQGDREQCLAAGMDDYVSKPVARDTLDAVICRWLAPLPEPAPSA